jgi:hypothetical protein
MLDSIRFSIKEKEDYENHQKTAKKNYQGREEESSL